MERRIHSWQGVLRLVVVAGLLASLSVLALGPSADAGKQPTAVAKVNATATKPDAAGKQVVTVTLTIGKDYYAYANPVKHEGLLNNQTIVKISSKTGKLEEVKVNYPPGKLKEHRGDKYQIYEGMVSITAQVRRAKADTGPLDVVVQYVACNGVKEFCLPQETVKLTVP